MNYLADVIEAYLLTKYARVYRNLAPMNPTYPYVLFTTSSTNDTYPSDDVSVNVYIYEKNDRSVSVRTIETLADTIDKGLNLVTVDNTNINARFVKDVRQLVNDSELSGVQFINIQYTARLYRKG